MVDNRVLSASQPFSIGTRGCVAGGAASRPVTGENSPDSSKVASSVDVPSGLRWNGLLRLSSQINVLCGRADEID
ncbi:MAG: hypothetical protein CSA32_02105 [Desulfobulbus propionicus]|nr:MAG: hypothetical protein CSA32_02105 [Desulfobulbus propionicus]